MSVALRLYRKAVELVTLRDPLIGIYSEGDAITVAVPIHVRGEPGLRYHVRTITGIDVRRFSPKVVARSVRAALGRCGYRCAVAMGLPEIFIGELQSAQWPENHPRIVVAQLMANPVHGVIAAKTSLVRRWTMIAHHAGLDLDVLTAGPIAVARGVSSLIDETRQGCGVILIQFAEAPLLCFCRDTAIIAVSPLEDFTPRSVAVVAGDWARRFQCEPTWSAVIGGAERDRHRALFTLRHGFGCKPLELSPRILESIACEGEPAGLWDEVAILGAVGCSARDGGH